MTKQNREFLIRYSTSHDSPGILDCLASAFAPYRDSYTPEAYLDTVLTEERLRQRLAEMSVLVAISSSTGVVGTLAYSTVEYAEGHLRGMAVRPEWQGSSVSAGLLERAESELRNAGCRTVTLDTTEPLQKAILFYEKHGFRCTGHIESFFGMPLFQYSKAL